MIVLIKYYLKKIKIDFNYIKIEEYMYTNYIILTLYIGIPVIPSWYKARWPQVLSPMVHQQTHIHVLVHIQYTVNGCTRNVRRVQIVNDKITMHWIIPFLLLYAKFLFFVSYMNLYSKGLLKRYYSYILCKMTLYTHPSTYNVVLYTHHTRNQLQLVELVSRITLHRSMPLCLQQKLIAKPSRL